MSSGSRVQSAYIIEWILANAPWLGYFFPATIGGLFYYALKFEASEVEWTARKHRSTIIFSLIKGYFFAVMVFLFCQGYFRWSPILCYGLAGLCAAFPDDAGIWMKDIGKRLLGAMTAPKGNDDGTKS